MITTQVIAQPWQDAELSLDHDAYMRDVLAQEKTGKRLVIQTYVNAHQDLDGYWWTDYIILTDYRTGETVLAYNPYEDEPVFDFESIALVRNELTEV